MSTRKIKSWPVSKKREIECEAWRKEIFLLSLQIIIFDGCLKWRKNLHNNLSPKTRTTGETFLEISLLEEFLLLCGFLGNTKESYLSLFFKKKEDVMDGNKEVQNWLARLYDECISCLNLRWPVNFFFDKNSPSCRSFVDFAKREYRIYVPSKNIEGVSVIKGDVISEFCRFKLGEEIDYIFSMPIFSTKYQNTKENNFEEKMLMLFFAQSHIDIWVRRLRHRHWPDLIVQEQELFLKALIVAFKKEGKDFIHNPGVMIGVAQYHAEQIRYDTKKGSDIFSFLNFSRVNIDEQLCELAEYLIVLPGLGFEAKKDLEILERTTLEISRILKFSINPRLVRENNLWVWDLD